MPTKRRYDEVPLLGMASRTSAPSRLSTSLTAAPVLFAWTTSAPVTVTPGTVTAMVPPSWSAMPVEVSRMRPLPSVSVATGVVPAVSVSPTWLATTRTTVAPACVVERSKARSPVRVCPPRVRAAPSASTRTYGPAGRSPTVAAPVLRATRTVPTVRTEPRPPPSVTRADRRPEIPAADSTRVPATWSRVTKSVPPAVRTRPPPVISSRVTGVPPTVERSTVSVPACTCWPATTRSSPVAETRKYGPAGTPPTVAGVVLRASETEEVLSETPGTCRAMLPVSVPLTPVLPKVQVPAPPVRSAASPSERDRPEKRRLKPSVSFVSSSRFAVRVWPRAPTVRPVPVTETYGAEVDVAFSVSEKASTTSSPPSPNEIVVGATRAVVWLTRTRTVPPSVTPAKPTSSRVPRTSSA